MKADELQEGQVFSIPGDLNPETLYRKTNRVRYGPERYEVERLSDHIICSLAPEEDVELHPESGGA